MAFRSKYLQVMWRMNAFPSLFFPLFTFTCHYEPLLQHLVSHIMQLPVSNKSAWRRWDRESIQRRLLLLLLPPPQQLQQSSFQQGISLLLSHYITTCTHEDTSGSAANHRAAKRRVGVWRHSPVTPAVFKITRRLYFFLLPLPFKFENTHQVKERVQTAFFKR